MSEENQLELLIEQYFKSLQAFMAEELELIGITVMGIINNVSPLSDKTLLSALIYRVETEKDEVKLFTYRKIPEVLLSGKSSV